MLKLASGSLTLMGIHYDALNGPLLADVTIPSLFIRVQTNCLNFHFD